MTPRDQGTPVPADGSRRDGSRRSDPARITAGVLTVLSLIGGGGGAAAWWFQRPASEQSRDTSEIQSLRETNKMLSTEIESGKLKRLDSVESRIGKLEKWQIRYGVVLDSIAERTLTADDLRKVQWRAKRAADDYDGDR